MRPRRRRAPKVFHLSRRDRGKLALTPDRRLEADGETFHPLEIAPPSHIGKLVQLPNGGHVGYRQVSSNTVPPTVDVNIPGIPFRKIKFLG